MVQPCSMPWQLARLGRLHRSRLGCRPTRRGVQQWAPPEIADLPVCWEAVYEQQRGRTFSSAHWPQGAVGSTTEAPGGAPLGPLRRASSSSSIWGSDWMTRGASGHTIPVRCPHRGNHPTRRRPVAEAGAEPLVPVVGQRTRCVDHPGRQRSYHPKRIRCVSWAGSAS